MGGSRLEIAGRTIARCKEGALDAEYALFEPADIELKATEPGNVREIGYRTTVAKARTRLGYAAVVASLAQAAADALRPIASVYARGRVVRRVVRYFGPSELFEGRDFDVKEGVYAGAWMDLAALSNDVSLPGAATAMQALHLAALLNEAPDDAIVMLHTLELTRVRRPGERTHKKVDLDATKQLPDALRALAETGPASPPEREAGPARIELLEAARERQKWCTHSDALVRLARIEVAASARDQPAKGPLADPELWALERQMSDSDASGVLEKLDALEKSRGRTPATTYLRARASLMRGIEEPAMIAARVSALALSMTSFNELELLAAQAWFAAGDARRAAPYAKDLMDNANVDPEIRTRAEAVYKKASLPPNAAPPPPPSPAPPAGPLLGKPIVSVGDDEAAPDTAIQPAPIVAVARNPTVDQPLAVAQPPSQRPPVSKSQHPPPQSVSQSQRPGVPYSAIGERSSRGSSRPKRRSAPPQEDARTNASEAAEAEEDAPPRGSIAPAPLQPVPEAAPTPVRLPSDPPMREVLRPPRRPFQKAGPGLVESRGERWADSRAEPDDAAPTPAVHGKASSGFMKGASQPPFRPEDVHESPRAVPRYDASHSEAAEHLSLPRNATGEPPQADTVPRTILEARVLFTHLSRELGAEYRQKRAIELRTDVNAIEAMQAHLFDLYFGHKVRSLDDWLDVRRHGAFLSEILVRTLGAEWVDIAQSELGYWAMAIPSGVRVWPFARVLRYVAMGPKERDLVSYYLELRSRAHGR